MGAGVSVFAVTGDLCSSTGEFSRLRFSGDFDLGEIDFVGEGGIICLIRSCPSGKWPMPFSSHLIRGDFMSMSDSPPLFVPLKLNASSINNETSNH